MEIQRHEGTIWIVLLLLRYDVGDTAVYMDNVDVDYFCGLFTAHNYSACGDAYSLSMTRPAVDM
jgi:hypothetical protein